jgi:predicted nucleic-acid-binding protein
VFLRFFLKDHPAHFTKAKKHFTQAALGEIKLILIPQVIFEINYVLKGVYSLSKKEIVDLLQKTLSSPTLIIKNRQLLQDSLETYLHHNVDLVNAYIYQNSKHQNAQVLSFDKKLNKIK